MGMVGVRTRIDKDRMTIYMQDKRKGIGMAMSSNVQVTQRSRIEMHERLAFLFNLPKDKVSALRKEIVSVRNGCTCKGIELLFALISKKDTVLLVPRKPLALERGITEICGKGN